MTRRVINADWIGVIEQIFEEGLVETEDKVAWRIADMCVSSPLSPRRCRPADATLVPGSRRGGMMDPGRTVAELFPADGPGPPPLPGHSGPRDLSLERIVDIRPIVVHVSWIALNQKVRAGSRIRSSRPRPG